MLNRLFLCLTLPVICCCSLPSVARAQAVVFDRVYTPPVGSDERVELMNSVRIAMHSPASKYKVAWLAVFHGQRGSVAVGTLEDVGAGQPVGTVFFEWDHGKWNARYLVATDGLSACGDYAAMQERILDSSKKVGAPASLFPQSFFDQYEEAKATDADANSCMGIIDWKATE
jgi:hypothetical protein